MRHIVHPQWITEGSTNPEFDYGLVQLPWDAPWMGPEPLDDESLLGLNCYVAGYPIDRSLDVWAAEGQIVSLPPNLVEHRIDTQDGQSGGPIFFIDSEGFPRVVGIHTQGASESNHGVRLTPDVLNQILEWAQSWGVLTSW